LPDQNQHICFKMEREELVNLGIIRNVVFNDNSNSPDHPSACQVSIFKKIFNIKLKFSLKLKKVN
jgi:hypothetical protein